MSAARAAALLLAAAAGCAPANALAEDDARTRASGGLAWIAGSDTLDLAGTMRAEVPLGPAGRIEPYASVGAVTAIERSVSHFTFAVHDVIYDVAAGVRGPHGLAAFAGRLGLERVDAPGEPCATYAGASWESEGFARAVPERPFEARFAVASILHDRELDLSGRARAEIRFTRKLGRFAWGADAMIDALVGGASRGTDFGAGPRLDVPLGGGRALSLQLRWLHGGSPLGLGTNGVTAGFEVVEGATDTLPRPRDGDVRGAVAAGAGSGRRTGRLRIAALSPAFGAGWRGVLDVDGRVLTARDTGELYYRYDLGIERTLGRWVAGGYAYHRSNHVLAEPNPLGVTSRNVVEAGIETGGWDHAAVPGGPRAGTLDGRLRAGYTIDSDFGERRRWNVRGGARWTAPWGGRIASWIAAEGEAGDVSGASVAVGASCPGGFEASIERLHDGQFFGNDRSAWLLSATRRF